MRTPLRRLAAVLAAASLAVAQEPLRVAAFAVDATPPIGSPLCDALVLPARTIVDRLTANGIVLVPPGQDPIVPCAVDWVGIGNGGQDAWRQALADAAGTTPVRVAVHCLHPRYLTYTVHTADGRALAGVLEAESAASLTLRRADGSLAPVRRAEILRLESTGRSLMPAGLEAAIPEPAMNDLLAWLRSRGQGPSARRTDSRNRPVGFALGHRSLEA
jgi:hypothetical protein